MPRRNVQHQGINYLVSDDDSLAPDLRWWAVMRTRIIDEITGVPPRVAVRISTTTAHCTPRVDGDGNGGLVGRPADVLAALTTPGALTAEVAAPGYLPRSLTAAIDAARRQLPAGAAIGDPQLVITPPEPAPRTQFTPGRGVALGRQAPTTGEEFNLVGLPIAPPAANQVPLAQPVAAAQAANTRLAGVPIVLADQPLHRATPAALRGRVRRQPAAGASPVPAPAAEVGVTGAWWSQPEVRQNSAPNHVVDFVSSSAPLAFDHAAGVSVEHCTLAPDATARRLAEAARPGAREISLVAWNGLNLAGGDVLQLELANSRERELVILDAFTAPATAANPARIPLRTPLAFPHGANCAVALMTVTPDPATTLAREAQCGDGVIFAASLANVATDAVLRLETASAREELCFVRRLPTYAGPVPLHQVTLQPDGTFQLPPIGRVAQLRVLVRHVGQIPEQIDFALDYGGDNTVEILLKPL